MVVGRLDKMSSHVATFWGGGGGGGGPFFDILDKSVWRRASLTPVSLLLYNKHVRCTNLQQIDLGAIPSRLDVQKHLDDLFHSAGKASPLLSGWGLSHNHSTTSVRTEGYKNLTYLKGNGDCCSYQQPILNNATANMNIPLTRGPIFSCRLTYLYAFRIVPATSTKFHDNFTKVRGVVKKYKEDIGIMYMNQEPGDVFCDTLADRFTNTSQVLVCGDDANVFILLFHHAHRSCDVIMELDVSGRNNLRCINSSDVARKNRPISEWGICCTVIQNLPKVVDIYSSPNFYSR